MRGHDVMHVGGGGEVVSDRPEGSRHSSDIIIS